MFFFINILFIFLFIFFINWFFKSSNNFTYIKIIKIYLIFLLIFILFSIKLNYLNIDQHFNFLCLILNFMFFISYLLIVGIRFINSPSYDIINYIRKNNPSKKNKILIYLKNKRIIEERIEVLTKEKLILLKNNNLILSNNGIIFCILFLFIKKFLGIETEG